MLDPDIAARVSTLTLQARRAVEGVLSGIHKSPHRGASVVFVEHREYRPGDDLRLLDWRAYARNDRHYIKRFEQETQLRASLVLDRSGSMAYGAKGATKLEHAATLLGAMAYLLIRQGDAAGVATFDRALVAEVPPRSRPVHLDAVLEALASPASSDVRGTDLARALMAVAERAGHRGLVAIASDLLDFDTGALAPLAHLVARGHDVIVFHVLHPDEIDFPFADPARFIGLEGEDPLDADPSLLRESYIREVQAFLHERRARCTAAGARYALARTDEAPEHTLAAVLTSTRRRGWG